MALNVCGSGGHEGDKQLHELDRLFEESLNLMLGRRPLQCTSDPSLRKVHLCLAHLVRGSGNRADIFAEEVVDAKPGDVHRMIAETQQANDPRLPEQFMRHFEVRVVCSERI